MSRNTVSMASSYTLVGNIIWRICIGKHILITSHWVRIPEKKPWGRGCILMVPYYLEWHQSFRQGFWVWKINREMRIHLIVNKVFKLNQMRAEVSEWDTWLLCPLDWLIPKWGQGHRIGQHPILPVPRKLWHRLCHLVLSWWESHKKTLRYAGMMVFCFITYEAHKFSANVFTEHGINNTVKAITPATLNVAMINYQKVG